MIRTRPSLTPSAALAAEVLERGGTISEAARTAGVSRPTVYAWIKREFSFRHHITESNNASDMVRKMETNVLSRLAVGAIAQILAHDDVPAAVRARVGLAVLEHGNAEGSKWGLPDPLLEQDASLPQPAIAALTAARKLYNFTPGLDTSLTATSPAALPQATETEAPPDTLALKERRTSPVKWKKETLYSRR